MPPPNTPEEDLGYDSADDYDYFQHLEFVISRGLLPGNIRVIIPDSELRSIIRGQLMGDYQRYRQLEREREEWLADERDQHGSDGSPAEDAYSDWASEVSDASGASELDEASEVDEASELYEASELDETSEPDGASELDEASEAGEEVSSSEAGEEATLSEDGEEAPPSEDGQGSTVANLLRTRTPPLDFHNLTYVSEYDENLNCPICQSPLVDPVMLRCLHIFCDKCITESLRHSQLCPVDRKRIPRADSVGRTKKAHHIIRNQLDNLRVRCPNIRCGKVCARGSIAYHYNHDCDYTKVQCSDGDCDGLVNRFQSDLPCLHHKLQCVECFEVTSQAELLDHLATTCTGKRVPCQFCKAEIPRCEESAHSSACSEHPVECCHKTVGCPFSAKRKDFGDHEAHCVYGLLVQLNKKHQDEITGLRQELVRTQEQVRQLESERVKTPPESSSSEMEWDAEQADASRGGSDRSTAEASNTGSVLPDAVMTLDEKVDLALATARNVEAKLETLEAYVEECAAQQKHVIRADIVPLHESVHSLNAGFGRLNQHMAMLVDVVHQRSPKRSGDSNSNSDATADHDSGNGGAVSQTTGLTGRRADENGFPLPQEASPRL